MRSRVVVELNPGSWRPRNYDHEFHGMVTLREALARSFNVSAVRLGDAVGLETGAARASAMGISSRLPIVHSLPLGSCMANPLEMARAYIPFATGGIARNTTAILKVEDRYGNLLESNEQSDPGRRVLSVTGAYFMNSMLQSVMRYYLRFREVIPHSRADYSRVTHPFATLLRWQAT